MPSQKSFGRRAVAQNSVAPEPHPETRISQPANEGAVRAVATQPAPIAIASDSEPNVDVDRELEEWKAARKIHQRSFREPWRTLAIASAVGFGLSSWLLPDSVADVTELVTGGLGAASFFAGFRIRPPVQKLSPGLGD